MRVISGKYRALKLAEFVGMDIRPTADRVKESLFNILFSVSGLRVLDLFCGSGALGIECISRGAKFVHFNDKSQKSLAVLGKNLKKIPNERGYAVTNMDFEECLYSLHGQFDIIFLDPPYAGEYSARALEIIERQNLLSKDGVAVVERDRPFDGQIRGLEVKSQRKYGITYLTFLGVMQ